MVNESLQAKLATFPKPVDMLRNAPPLKLFSLAYAPPQHSNWRDEQAAWMSTAVLFDQSNHMNDAYFKGPDVVRLLSDTGINSFAKFSRNKSKQFMVCGYDGSLIGTSVLFGLEDDEVSLVGPSACANWVQYQAESAGTTSRSPGIGAPRTATPGGGLSGTRSRDRSRRASSRRPPTGGRCPRSASSA